MWRIGIDEAGRGPVIGPLVVGALCIPETDLPLLHEAGVTDSKLLSESKRIELDAWIREQAIIRNWTIELHISKPAEIDRAMALTNLNDHEVTLFAALARKLRIDGGGILQLDACDVDANRFGNNVASRLSEWPWDGWSMDSRHGADLHCLAVAGATGDHAVSAHSGVRHGGGIAGVCAARFSAAGAIGNGVFAVYVGHLLGHRYHRQRRTAREPVAGEPYGLAD